MLFEGNKIVKHFVDDWIFSGTDIASGGQPIFMGMSGTVYSGTTSATSYGDEGNIFGGAISSGSGLATTGRPPQIGRNSIIGPGFNNLDFRVSRNFPIYEKIYLQFSADAFNLLNHQIITGVVGSYSPTSTSAQPRPAPLRSAAPRQQSRPAPRCRVASPPTPTCATGTDVGQQLNAFGATSGTNNGLYTARQMQFSAKLFF